MSANPSRQISQRESWRFDFCSRLDTAVAWLAGDSSICSTHYAHIKAFDNLLKDLKDNSDSKYKKEIEKLTTFELKVYSISSTARQLTSDLEFFTACEVRAALTANFARKERCDEVEAKFFTSKYPELRRLFFHTSQNYNQSSNEQWTKSVADWVITVLNKDCVQFLSSLLIQHLDHDKTTTSTLGESVLEHNAIARRASDVSGSTSLTNIRYPHLSSDCLDLLYIISFAGGQIPDCFFDSALIWTELGEAQTVEIIVPEVLMSSPRRKNAISQLLDGQLLLELNADDHANTLMIHPHTSQSLCLETTNAAKQAQWRECVLAALCKAFPRWPHIFAKPLHCKLLLPVLRNVLSYHYENLSPIMQTHLADVCISASYFGSLSWKNAILQIANQINPMDPLLQFKINLRNRMMKRLQGKDDGLIAVYRPNLVSPSFNAYYGEQILFEMQGLLDCNAPISTLEQHFAKFVTTGSKQERQILLCGHEFIARAIRFEGDFKEAEKRYLRLMEEYPIDARPARFMASYIEVLCELRKWQSAVNILNIEFDSRQNAPGRRLEMVHGHICLTKALWDFHDNEFLCEESLISAQTAKTVYTRHRRNLQGIGKTSKTDKANNFLACAGIAMAEHVLGLHYLNRQSPLCNDHLQSALISWKEAGTVAKNSWKRPGYSETIALYSQSELAYLLGQEQAEVLRKAAQQTFQSRQFFCVAQGSVWFQILAESGAKYGRSPLRTRPDLPNILCN